MGVAIGPDDVALRKMTPDSVPVDVTWHQISDVLGRTPREHILASEPVREERLARPDAGVGLNAIITPGRRAMTVATDVQDAIAGLIQPGNYVDIIVTIKPDDAVLAGAKWLTETIIQGAKVLAVGGNLGQDSSATAPAEADKKKKASSTKATKTKPSITLEVTPEDAERLALAVSRGDIAVVLRSDTDILQIAQNGATTARNLLGTPGNLPPPPPKVEEPRKVEEPAGPPPVQAEVISGSSKTRVQFQQGGGTQEESQKGPGRRK
jgi:pilus assembly protein CpaB